MREFVHFARTCVDQEKEWDNCELHEQNVIYARITILLSYYSNITKQYKAFYLITCFYLIFL